MLDDFKYKLYGTLTALFVVIIITNNLIYQKFIAINLIYKFEISAGTITYPLTFFIMELITEIYGAELAKACLRFSLVISLFIAIVIYTIDGLEALPWSRIDDKTFHLVFGGYSISLFGSLMANYLAQSADIKIYQWLRRLANYKYFWIRAISSNLAMLIDVIIINLFISFYGVINSDRTFDIIIDSYLFKFLITCMITPFFKMIIQRLNKC